MWKKVLKNSVSLTRIVLTPAPNHRTPNAAVRHDDKPHSTTERNGALFHTGNALLLLLLLLLWVRHSNIGGKPRCCHSYRDPLVSQSRSEFLFDIGILETSPIDSLNSRKVLTCSKFSMENNENKRRATRTKLTD